MIVYKLLYRDDDKTLKSSSSSIEFDRSGEKRDTLTSCLQSMASLAPVQESGVDLGCRRGGKGKSLSRLLARRAVTRRPSGASCLSADRR